MLYGPRFGALSIVNSFGTLLVGLCEIQEAYSKFSSSVAAFNFLSFDARPSPKVAVFITIIVEVPIIQILTMVLAVIIICIELPLPLIKTLSLYRSLVLRIILLIFQSCLALLFYQVRSLTKILLYSADSRSGD